MARKRKATATITQTYEMVPRRQPSLHELHSGSRAWLEGSQWTTVINGISVLHPKIEIVIKTIIENGLQYNLDVQSLYLALYDYCKNRCAETNPIVLTDAMEHANNIRSKSKELLDLMYDYSEAAKFSRESISNIDLHGAPQIDWDAFTSSLSLIFGKCSSFCTTPPNTHSNQISEEAHAWPLLISQLADLYAKSGRQPTAAKSSRAKAPKPSPFVQIVYTLITEAIPEPYREHAQSQASMADAVNEALRTWRSARKGQNAGGE